MKRQLLLLLLTCCLGLFAFSQGIVINGTVKSNENNEPIPKASVRIKNGAAGVLTDEQGKFRISVASLPVTLEVSGVESDLKEVTITNADEITVILQLKEKMLDPVIIGGGDGRLKGSKFQQPISIETIGRSEINNSPLAPYSNLLTKKNVVFTTSSLTFNTPSTRGFNGSGSTRVNQIVDGMDNQAPGLNFFVGNFTGLTDLDIASIELLPGASSALYGPGGMNGTILINSKNPFKDSGLSVQVKQGIMHVDKRQRANASPYNDYSLRWAKTFNNRFGFKIGAQYLSAKDWLANDSSNYLRAGTSGKLIPGNRATDPNYDGVNVYGDETSVDIYPFLAGVLGPNHPLTEHIPVSRTGYSEKDVIDPVTKNIKLSGAMHYKFSDKLEGQLMGYWSTGNTVYTDDNRYALKGIKIGQYKLELKHKDWFLRSYTTQENAGEAYSATVATQFFNEAWKRSFDNTNIPGSWYPQFTGAYLQARMAGVDKMTALNIARSYADQGRPEAGSDQFKQIFDQVRKIPIPNGGLFREKSQLWMTEGQYRIPGLEKIAEVIVGASYKNYILDSDGTLFIDTLKAISIKETGGYVQITKKVLNDLLTLVASGRFDKNENFKAQFTPRFAALIKLNKDNNFRMSYQTAYRFPGNLSQWIRLNVGGDFMLLGGLPWVMDYMHTDKNPVYEVDQNGVPASTPYVYREFKPETMRAFEFGYKSLIKNKLLIDAYAYFGKYEDFIGRIGLFQPGTNNAYSIVVNSVNSVRTHGYGFGMDYRMKNNFSAFFNAYSDVITDVPSGFKSYFNTPKYKLNAGFGNTGLGKKELVGFNILARWQDSFEWEGELANGPLKSITTVDAQVSYKLPKINSMIRLGGTNIFNKYYKNGYGNPEIGGVYYASFIYRL